MSLTLLTVTGGAHGWTNPDGSPANGKVTLQPVNEAPGGGYIIVSTPETFSLASGNISGVIASNAEATTLQYIVHEAIVGADNPRAYVVSPAGSVLDLSAAPRGTRNMITPLYVLASTVGAPGGVAALDQGTKLALSQDRDGYGSAAGLLDATVLTPYGSGGTVTLASGTYTNLAFVVDELLLPNNNTVLRNCSIVAAGQYGVRMDANTGEETGRLIEHCTITAAGPALAGAGFTARNILVTHNGDDFCRIGRSHAEPTVIEDCVARDFRPNANAHADGVQVLTEPAADVIVRRCDISMNTASGYTLPSDAGYTGAIFIAYDVAVPGGDPEPTRSGFVWVDGCRLQSSGNYTVVVDQSGVDISNCEIGAGFTAAESINNGVAVTGSGNTDLTGVPLVTAIHSDCRPRYLAVGDPRQTGSGGSSTLAGLTDVAVGGVSNGEFLEWNGVHWVPGTPSGGGGGSTLAVRSAFITSGTVSLANTSGTWQVVPQVTGPAFEIDIPAVAGDWVEIDFNGLRTGTNVVDIAVIKASSLVRFLATGTSTPAVDGDVGWYDSGGSFALHGSTRGFSATSGDIDGGSVRFVLVTIGGGSGQVLATASDTFYWQVKNYGPHT